MKTTLITLLSLLLAGCAMDEGLVKVINSDLDYQYLDGHPPKGPADGYSMVCVYSHFDVGHGSYVYMRGRKRTVVIPGTYSCFEDMPGRVSIAASLQGNRSQLAVTLEPGRSYFARYTVREGMVSQNPELQLVGEEAGRSAITGLRRIALP